METVNPNAWVEHFKHSVGRPTLWHNGESKMVLIKKPNTAKPVSSTGLPLNIVTPVEQYDRMARANVDKNGPKYDAPSLPSRPSRRRQGSGKSKRVAKVKRSSGRSNSSSSRRRHRKQRKHRKHRARSSRGQASKATNRVESQQNTTNRKSKNGKRKSLGSKAKKDIFT